MDGSEAEATTDGGAGTYVKWQDGMIKEMSVLGGHTTASTKQKKFQTRWEPKLL